MSKKKRSLEKQAKQNSPARKAKAAKKAKYVSPESKIRWEQKKAARQKSKGPRNEQ